MSTPPPYITVEINGTKFLAFYEDKDEFEERCLIGCNVVQFGVR
jgi:hypothetical protein